MRTSLGRVKKTKTSPAGPCVEPFGWSDEDMSDGACGHKAGNTLDDPAEPVLVYSVSMCPSDAEVDEQARQLEDATGRVETPAARRPQTPFWTAGRTGSPLSVSEAEYGMGSGKKYLMRQRAIRAVAHFAALLCLGAADVLFFLEHGGRPDKEEVFTLSVILFLFYAGLAVWLVVSCTLPTTWELSGLGIARLPKTWLVLALTHTAMAFVSAWWRKALSLSGKVDPAAHAAAVISMLQLLLTVLYPSDPVVSVILACLSVIALITIEVSMGVATLVIVDNALLLLCAGVTCTVAASWHYWADRNLQMKSKLVNCFIENIFQPIITKNADAQHVSCVTTHIGLITKRLKEAKDRSVDSALDDDMKDIFNSFFGFLLEALTDLNSLDQMSIQNLDLSPMTAEYVQKTLGQGGNHSDALETVEKIQRTIDANLPTESSMEEARTIPEGEEVEEAGAQEAEAEAGEAEDYAERPPAQWTSVSSADDDKVGAACGDSGEGLKAFREHASALPRMATVSSDCGRTAGTPASASKPWNGPKPTPPMTPCNALTFDENIEVLSRALRARNWERLPSPKVSDDFNRVLQKKLGLWHFDIFRLTSYVGGRPLVVVGDVALRHAVSKMHIEASRVRNFLNSIESRYVPNPYHNSMHGADVMNNLLYFLRLQDTTLAKLEPIEHLAVLTAAAAHDVGHDGFANRFHIGTESPLARLFNDQSPLENMHCAIAFAALREARCNFIGDLEAPARTIFRGYVTQMILETDLAKHFQTLTRFSQELLRGDADAGHHSLAQRKELATFALKCSDVAHSTKHFDLHVLWTLRISEEFFHQGDTERSAGLPCSPFCDRENINVAESQRGFYDFIVCPLFKAMDDHLGGSLQGEIMRQMDRNSKFWKRYDGAGFNYEEPVMNAGLLCNYYQMWYGDRPGTLNRRQSWNLMPYRQPSDISGQLGGEVAANRSSQQKLTAASSTSAGSRRFPALTPLNHQLSGSATSHASTAPRLTPLSHQPADGSAPLPFSAVLPMVPGQPRRGSNASQFSAPEMPRRGSNASQLSAPEVRDVRTTHESPVPLGHRRGLTLAGQALQ